jgi:hypothetical protein
MFVDQDLVYSREFLPGSRRSGAGYNNDIQTDHGTRVQGKSQGRPVLKKYHTIIDSKLLRVATVKPNSSYGSVSFNGELVCCDRKQCDDVGDCAVSCAHDQGSRSKYKIKNFQNAQGELHMEHIEHHRKYRLLHHQLELIVRTIHSRENQLTAPRNKAHEADTYTDHRSRVPETYKMRTKTCEHVVMVNKISELVKMS